MKWREQWARLSARERQLIIAAVGVLGLLLLRYLVISPFMTYRGNLQEEIEMHRERLENATAYLARAGDIAQQREQLHARFEQVRAQLIPGDTPTLAAANLQNTLHGLASERSVEIQSTQVMRDETVGDFRRVAVRITVTSELKGLADFLGALEHGQQRVSIPFLEIGRRGAVLRGKSGRALSATIEVSAFLRDTGAAPKEPATDQAEPSGAPPQPTPERST